MKTIFEGYVVDNLDVGDFMEIKTNVVGVPDSYMTPSTIMFISGFEGGKKIRVTVEEIDEE